MKKLILPVALLLLSPMVVQAACTTSSFKLTSFKVETGNSAHPIMKMPGQLVNNCSSAAAPQLVIEAKAADGSVIQKRKFWPAGTANIAPGKTVKFDAGRMFRFNPAMQSYAVSVVAVRTW